ncbi:thiamine phosphate synthase [Prosthecomicrobium sp. N25]|uniref:thiamine phosphate synthase n=1 Tax=Prosthecomicrobium sp. N25 TaxID=3129254 RepID=UPI00307880D3
MSRLYLVTPAAIDLATFPALLDEALGAVPVASLLVAPLGLSDMALQRVAEVLTPIGQRHDAAVLVRNDTRAAGRAKADGVHVDGSLAELKQAVEAFRPRSIVGAGGLKTRHDAMAAAETGADYVFFGMIDRPEDPEAHPKSLELAGWWMPLFETPCVCLAGADLASVAEVARTGADFVGLRDAVWAHEAGPAAALVEAARLIEAHTPERLA